MTSEPNLEPNKITPLSQARSNRKNTNQAIETTEDRLREILIDVVDDRLTAKLNRLETSINRMINQFDAVRTGEAKDAALRVTTDLEATDIALSSISLPKEQCFPYSCADLAEKLGVRIYDITTKIKELNLRGDEKFHLEISIGKTSKTHKWSEAALQKLKEVFSLKQSTCNF
jgi:hypothetical protein